MFMEMRLFCAMNFQLNGYLLYQISLNWNIQKLSVSVKLI